MYRKLIVDEYNDLFDIEGLEYIELSSDFPKIREYTMSIVNQAPEDFKEGNLLEQQISEIIKNGIKHGNKNNAQKKLKIWYSFKKRVRFIAEDEGDGFQNLDEWNIFFMNRQKALAENDFDTFVQLANYRSKSSDESDGGNSLIAALEYWNGGMIWNQKKNKIGVIRWFTNGFSRI
ncbi:MAG: ATP-binding protein [Spirochaetes bacterium GWF1_41_5]|nr:MAG: ATP-binding protein [Spirochaetes bacterium GWF1_41_5]